MKHKGMKILAMLLTLAMVVGLLPGMSLTAYAAESWSGSVTKSGSISGGVTLTADTTLTINSGNTLTVSGGISGGKTLTVTGGGTLVVNGSNGSNGSGGENGGPGSAGGAGVIGNLIVDDASATITGGSGGSGDEYGGAGGNGGSGVSGSLTVNSGTVEVIGGAGGSGGYADIYDGGKGGSGGSGVSGSLTVNSGTVEVTGGAGGNGGNAYDMAGGNGGDGGIGVSGNVTLEGGTSTITCGNGGAGGGSNPWGQSGSGANGISGDITSNSGTATVTGGNGKAAITGTINAAAQESDDNSAWSDISNKVSTKRYVKVTGADHTHSFTYAAGTGDKANTITATCTEEGCNLPESSEGANDHVATLTIAAPTTDNDATITVSPEGALTGYSVKYQTKSGGTWSDETTTAPSNPGIHKATVTLEGKEASVTYGNNCINYATGLTNGNITGDTGATCGATITPTITPDQGYELDALTVTPEAGSGVSTVTVDGGTFVMPEANVTVSATFKKINRAITLTQPATGGTLTAKKGDNAVTTADYGDTITLGNTPAAGYTFTSYSVTKTGDNNTVVPVNNGTFTMPEYPVTVTGTFTAIDYDVTVNSAENGSVTAKKGTSVVTTANIGDEITLTYNPSAGYQLDTVTVKDASNQDVTVTNDKFTMPASAVTVSATFKEITYTVAVDAANGAKATVTDSLPTPNTYTAELKDVPSDKTYDGEPVDLTAATVQKSADFPDNKVTVGAVSFKDQNGNTVTAATDVGTYTASATVGDKTISKSFTINGQANPITYVKKTKGSPVLTTTNQYIPVVNNPNGITVLKEGRTYVAKGDIEIGALIYMGDVKLILGKNTTLTVYAGIYHIGSSLEIYPEQGAEETSHLIVKGNKTLASLNNYADFNGQTISDANAALSGTIGVYGGKLTVEQGNSNLVSDDINLTLGARVSVNGLTGGTENTDGSVTYSKAAFASLTSLAVKPLATVKTAPTAKTTLIYTGSAQALISAGSTDEGTMKYAVTTTNAETASDAYTFNNTSLPTATDAGTYYVWYKAVGDADHSDSTPACVTVTIAALTEPVINGYALELGGVLGLRYYMLVPDGFDATGAAMTFAMNNRENQVIPYSDIKTDTQGNYFSCNVYAYQMADTITATFTYKKDGATKTLTDTYSVAQYLNNTDWQQYPQAVQTLVTKTRAYGHFVQPYLASVNGWTVGGKYAELDYTGAVNVDAALDGSKANKFTLTTMNSAYVQAAQYRLLLNADTSLIVEIRLKNTPAGSVSMTVNGNAVTPTVSGTAYRVEIGNIAANNLGVPHNVVMKIGSTTVFDFIASPLSYVYTVLSKSNPAADEQNALAALYEYWQAAYDYRHA